MIFCVIGRLGHSRRLQRPLDQAPDCGSTAASGALYLSVSSRVFASAALFASKKGQCRAFTFCIAVRGLRRFACRSSSHDARARRKASGYPDMDLTRIAYWALVCRAAGSIPARTGVRLWERRAIPGGFGIRLGRGAFETAVNQEQPWVTEPEEPRPSHHRRAGALPTAGAIQRGG